MCIYSHVCFFARTFFVVCFPYSPKQITSKGFETQLVNIQEGEAVHWKNENEDSNNQCLVQEMEWVYFFLASAASGLKVNYFWLWELMCYQV